MKVAFEDYEIEKLIDDFPISRTQSKRLFETLGFKNVIEEDSIIFSMTKDEYEKLHSFS
jgi:hypothetical protein